MNAGSAAISTLSPYLESIVSPSFIVGDAYVMNPLVQQSVSPVHFISDPNSIIPPVKSHVIVSTNPLIPPVIVPSNPLISPVLSPNLIISEDIFVPTVQLVSNGRNVTLPMVLYDDVCDIENIKSQIVKMYYYKLLDKWLYDKDDGKKVLNLLKVSGDKVNVIENINDRANIKEDTQEIVDKKVDFIEKNIVTQRDIYHILEKFVNETHISWCRLIKVDDLVKSSIIHSIKNKIKKLIHKK
jgi:hypothetical protein